MNCIPGVRRILPLLFLSFANLLFAQRGDVTALFKTPAKIESLVQVAVPKATCAAVSDTLSLLAIGHKAANGNHVDFFKIDASGNASPSTSLALPRADSLKSYDHFPLSLLFHPTLPLLYVWQDIEGPEVGVPDQNPVFKEFDHLLIYLMKDGIPQLVYSSARGPSFAYKEAMGTIAFDPALKKLFLPNLRIAPFTARPATEVYSIGYYQLGPQGVPIQESGKKIPQLYQVGVYYGYPVGLGFVAGSGDAVIFGAKGGPTIWEFENRRASICMYSLGLPAVPFAVAGHPKLPVVFGSSLGSYICIRMEHVDGFLTLLPQKITIPNANLKSAPIVLTRSNKVAFGGVNALYLVKLDSEGRYTAEAEMVALKAPSLQALVYSEKSDRLYAAVEGIP